MKLWERVRVTLANRRLRLPFLLMLALWFGCLVTYVWVLWTNR